MYVEFNQTTDILQQGPSLPPDTQVTVLEVDSRSTGSLRLVCTVSNSFERFEEAVSGDFTVNDMSTVFRGEDRRLYQLSISEETIDKEVYELSVDLGAVYLNSVKTKPGWYTKMNFPNKDKFLSFKKGAEDVGMEIEPTVLREDRFYLSDQEFGLSEKQEEIIQSAIQNGYFEVPRGATLNDLAQTLDISDQAASARLRRGLKTLSEQASHDSFSNGS